MQANDLSMKRSTLTLVCMGTLATAGAQLITRPDTVTVKNDQPVYVEKLASDPLVSSFIIEIEKEVAMHFHKQHSEHVYVISGAGMLTLDNETYTIEAGNLIYIPPATLHSVVVTSEEPMRVISIQAPEFSGRDRVFVRPQPATQNTDEGRY